MAAHENRIDDEQRAEGLASDANTIVSKTDHDAEKTADFDADNTDIEAEKTDVEGDSSSGNAAPVLPEDTLSPSDYPEGLQFFFILLALVFSIFMVALDLVCIFLPIFLSSDARVQVADFHRTDHRSNSHPKDYRSVPQCFRYWMVWVGLLPHCGFVHIALGQAF